MAFSWLFAFKNQENTPSPVSSGYTQLTGSLMIATSKNDFYIGIDNPTVTGGWVAGPEVISDYSTGEQIVAWASSSLVDNLINNGESDSAYIGFWKAQSPGDTSLNDLLVDVVLPQIPGAIVRTTLTQNLAELKAAGGWSSKDTDINPWEL